MIADKPKPSVKLVGTDGNAFALLGSVKRALQKAKWTPAEIGEFMKEAMSGDYDHLLATCCKYCDVH
jgi:hypothetical protein